MPQQSCRRTNVSAAAPGLVGRSAWNWSRVRRMSGIWARWCWRKSQESAPPPAGSPTQAVGDGEWIRVSAGRLGAAVGAGPVQQRRGFQELGRRRAQAGLDKGEPVAGHRWNCGISSSCSTSIVLARWSRAARMQLSTSAWAIPSAVRFRSQIEFDVVGQAVDELGPGEQIVHVAAGDPVGKEVVEVVGRRAEVGSPSFTRAGGEMAAG